MTKMINRELTVLAIDDDEEDARLLRHALEDMVGDHLTFIYSPDAESGMTALANHSVDITFLDHRLGPDLSPEILEAIRETGDIRPIVVLTGQSDAQTAASVLRAGADDYLMKSIVSPTVLRRTIQHAEDRYHRRLAEQALNQKNRELASLLEREKKISQKLQDAVVRAEAATRSKSEFLANMSHEIRTPMTAILGYIDVLEDFEQSGVDRKKITQVLRRNGEHLLAIINDILDISKIEAGKLEIEHVSCSLIDVVQDVKAMMLDRAAAKDLFLNIECAAPIPEVICSDPTRLRQILINLVGNAIKFTTKGGIRLIAELADPSESSEPRIVFNVIDSGIGMTKEQEQILFQAFAQADASTTRKYGGTGLGLVISKRLAQMMGGDITVACIPDQGCAFRVTIGTGSLDGVNMIEQFGHDPPEDCDVNSPKTETLSLAVRVLLAEDTLDNQRLISFLLRKAGVTVEIAENGCIACEKASAALQDGQPFDVILMDIQMPEMDGYTATRRLRDEGYKYPIVALTAHAMSSDRERCLEAGCDDFLAKPVDKKKMYSVIAKFTRTQNSTAA